MKQIKVDNKSRTKQFVLCLVFLGALLLPIVGARATYLLYILCLVELYIIAVSGLDILFGYSGQISIGHAGFYAIGAYGSALLHQYTGFPVIVTMLLGAVIAALIATFLAYPASKLVFHFLSLATVAFGEIVYQLVSRSPNNITGNYNGMYSNPISIFGMQLKSSAQFFYFGLACVVIFLALKVYIVNSKIGRAFIAIRENSHAANGMGINVRKYKIIAFAMSAFYTAFAGGMYVHFVLYISPDTFVQKQSVLFLTMLLFGGTGSLLGPIIGVVSLMFLTEALRSLQDYQMLVYGILLLLVIVAIPGGLYGAFELLFHRLKNKITKTKQKSEA